MIDCENKCPRKFPSFGGGVGDRGDWITCAGCTRDQLIRADVITERDKEDLVAAEVRIKELEKRVEDMEFERHEGGRFD